MARLLFVWELGWQLSHLSNMEMIIRPLVNDGHEIAVAARELQSAHDFFSGIVLQYYQSPFKQGETPVVTEYLSYSHLLYTAGYADPRELSVLLSAWFGILSSFRPDVIVFDHSPTALLASRAFNTKRVLIGSGFLIPPVEPLLGIFPDTPQTPEVMERLKHDEQIILDNINQALSPYSIKPISKLSDIYSQADESFLLSFPEFDHFGERKSMDYYGVWPALQELKPEWPAGNDPHIFVYITSFPGCRTLLKNLKSMDAAVLIYAPGISRELKEEVTGDNLVFTEELVSLDYVADNCDLFISHGAHTSVVRMLMKGIPQVMIPKYKEHLFTALRVKKLGAGLICEHDQDSYIDTLTSILKNKDIKNRALDFSLRYQNFDSEDAIGKITTKLKALLPN